MCWLRSRRLSMGKVGLWWLRLRCGRVWGGEKRPILRVSTSEMPHGWPEKSGPDDFYTRKIERPATGFNPTESVYPRRKSVAGLMEGTYSPRRILSNRASTAPATAPSGLSPTATARTSSSTATTTPACCGPTRWRKPGIASSTRWRGIGVASRRRATRASCNPSWRRSNATTA